jgi:hypothetical protein
MRTVHVVPGNSGAGSLKIALGESSAHAVIALRDELSCGPLPKVATLSEWAHARRSFWTLVAPFPDNCWLQEVLPETPLLANAETITLWLANGLRDQVTLAWFFWFLRIINVETQRVGVAPIWRTDLTAWI